MKSIYNSISTVPQIIFFLVFLSFSTILSVSQTNQPKPSNLIFVETGVKKTYSSLEDNIKSFGLDHVNSMIAAYNSKLLVIDTNDIKNEIWFRRIKYELVLLKKRKIELSK